MAELGWTLPPSRFLGVAEKEHTELMQALAIDVGTRLVRKTPVDTGRARNGWLPSVNAPSVGEGASVDPSGQAAITRIRTVFARQGVQKYSIFFLTNNVPYIGELNDGSSRQAPAHFVEQTVSEVVDAF